LAQALGAGILAFDCGIKLFMITCHHQLLTVASRDPALGLNALSALIDDQQIEEVVLQLVADKPHQGLISSTCQS